jgi:hypothetical protein
MPAKVDWQECIRPWPGLYDETPLHISINKRGDIVLNDTAWWELDRPEGIRLLYDEARRRIGLVKVDPGARNAFQVRSVCGRPGKIVRAARLLRQFDIKIDRTIAFRTLPEETKNVFVLDLTTAVVSRKVTHHWRRKKVSSAGVPA